MVSEVNTEIWFFLVFLQNIWIYYWFFKKYVDSLINLVHILEFFFYRWSRLELFVKFWKILKYFKSFRSKNFKHYKPQVWNTLSQSISLLWGTLPKSLYLLISNHENRSRIFNHKSRNGFWTKFNKHLL